MDKDAIVEQTATYVRQRLEGEGSGHDWWHVYRVWKLAERIAQAEGADLHIVQLAALLHDIADWKFHGGDEAVGPRLAEEWLREVGAEEPDIEHVCRIIRQVSFKGAKASAALMETIEGAVVQDADRLDAIGAIGIARAFAYGGYAGREIHNPDIEAVMHSSFEEYKASRSTSVNHFYEKLLLLKDRMNTRTAKMLAEGRHSFIEGFLVEFFSEWDGLK